jgi:transposase-like protein
MLHKGFQICQVSVGCNKWCDKYIKAKNLAKELFEEKKNALHLSQQCNNNGKIRKEIKESKESISETARSFNISRKTVLKWKNRETVEDKSSRPHKLNTKLTEVEEYVIVEVRKSTLLPLDDLLIVMREFIPQLSRAALARCLSRYGVSNLKAISMKEPGHNRSRAGIARRISPCD